MTPAGTKKILIATALLAACGGASETDDQTGQVPAIAEASDETAAEELSDTDIDAKSEEEAQVAAPEMAVYSGEASMNGGTGNGMLLETLRNSGGGEIDLDLRFGYLAMAGSFDLADECSRQLGIPEQPDQKGIDNLEFALVVTPTDDLWDFTPAEVGQSVACRESVTFDFDGFGPNAQSEGVGVGYHPIKGTFAVEKRREGKRTRYILTEK